MFSVPDWDEQRVERENGNGEAESSGNPPPRKRKFDSVAKKLRRLGENSPGAKKPLIEVEKKKDKSESSVGEILRKGVKFSGLEEFCKFMDDGKKRKKKTHKNDDDDETESASGIPPAESEPGNKKKKPSKLEEAKRNLKSSRFRYLNEKLYTQRGQESYSMFRKDPQAFKVYHEGYQEQAKKWPLDPLERIANSLIKMSDADKRLVVADMGCGEAKLAASLDPDSFQVHSFDLVASDGLGVIACDMARTPLEDSSADAVVYCLSLMGTNLKDYIREANRVLKREGVLKIAEVESRFAETSVDEFISAVEKLGFKLKWKDSKDDFFVFFDLKKVADCGSKMKKVQFELKPCLYKKR